MYLRKNVLLFKEKRGFTPYKLRELGIPLSTSQNIVDGTTKDPRISIVIKLAKIYNVSIDDLLLKDLEKEGI